MAGEEVNPIIVALTVLLAVVLIAYLLRTLGLAGAAYRERFASKKAHELHRRTVDVFSQNGRATYSEYKAAIPEADPVLYHDVRQKWRGGKLTPEEVERVM